MRQAREQAKCVVARELRDGVEHCGLEYIDEVEENLKKGVVDRHKEEEDGMGY